MSALKEVVQQLEDILKTSNQYGPFVCLDASPPVNILPVNTNGQCSTDDGDGIQKKKEASPELTCERDIFMSRGLGLHVVHQGDNDEVIYVEKSQEIETFEWPSKGLIAQGRDVNSNGVLYQGAPACQVQEGGTVTARSPLPSTCEVYPLSTIKQLSSTAPLLQNCSDSNLPIHKYGLDGEGEKGKVDEEVQPIKRKRGRPRKPIDPNAVPKIMRSRGRPRKIPATNVEIGAVSAPSDAVGQCCTLSKAIESQDSLEKDLLTEGSSNTGEASLEMFIETQQEILYDLIGESKTATCTPTCTIPNTYCDAPMPTSYLTPYRHVVMSGNDLNLETDVQVPDDLNNSHGTGVSIDLEAEEEEAGTATENSGVDPQRTKEHPSTPDLPLQNSSESSLHIDKCGADGRKLKGKEADKDRADHTPKRKRGRPRKPINPNPVKKIKRAGAGKIPATNVEIGAVSVPNDAIAQCCTVPKVVESRDSLEKDVFTEGSLNTDEASLAMFIEKQQDIVYDLTDESTTATPTCTIPNTHCDAPMPTGYLSPERPVVMSGNKLNLKTNVQVPDDLNHLHGTVVIIDLEDEKEEAGTATENCEVDPQVTREQPSTPYTALQNSSESSLHIGKGGVDGRSLEGKEEHEDKADHTPKRKRGRPRKPIDPNAVPKIKRSRARAGKIPATNVEIGAESVPNDAVGQCCTMSKAIESQDSLEKDLFTKGSLNTEEPSLAMFIETQQGIIYDLTNESTTATCTPTCTIPNTYCNALMPTSYLRTERPVVMSGNKLNLKTNVQVPDDLNHLHGTVVIIDLEDEKEEAGTATENCEVDPQVTREQPSTPYTALQNSSESSLHSGKGGVDGRSLERKEEHEDKADHTPKRKRGRPRKPIDPNAVPKIERSRGRPRKIPATNVEIGAVSVPNDAIAQCCTMSKAVESQDSLEKDMFTEGSSNTEEPSLAMFIETQQGIIYDLTNESTTFTPTCIVPNTYSDAPMPTGYLRTERPVVMSGNELNLETDVQVPDDFNHFHGTGVSIDLEAEKEEAGTATESCEVHVDPQRTREQPSTPDTSLQNSSLHIDKCGVDGRKLEGKVADKDRADHTPKRKRGRPRKPINPNPVPKIKRARAGAGKIPATNMEIGAVSVPNDAIAQCCTMSKAVESQDSLEKDMFTEGSSNTVEPSLAMFIEKQQGIIYDLTNESATLTPTCIVPNTYCDPRPVVMSGNELNLETDVQVPDDLNNFHGTVVSIDLEDEKEEAGTATENCEVDGRNLEGKEEDGDKADHTPKRKRGRPNKTIDPNPVPKSKRSRGRPRKIPATNVEIGAVAVPNHQVVKCCTLSYATGIENSIEKSNAKNNALNACSFNPTCTLATNTDTEKRTKSSYDDANGLSSHCKTLESGANEVGQNEISRRERNDSSEHHSKDNPKKIDLWEKETAAVNNRTALREQEVPKLRLRRKTVLNIIEIPDHGSETHILCPENVQGIIPNEHCLTAQERSSVNSSLSNALSENAESDEVLQPPGCLRLRPKVPPVQTDEEKRDTMIKIRTVVSENQHECSLMQRRDEEIVRNLSIRGQEQCEKVTDRSNTSEALPGTEAINPKHVGASPTINARTCNGLLNTSAQTVADPTIKRPRGRPRKKTLRNRELTTKSTGYDDQIVHKSKEVPPVQTDKQEKDTMIQIRTVVSENQHESSLMQRRDEEIVSNLSIHGQEQCKKVTDWSNTSEALPGTEAIIPKHVGASPTINASTCNALLNTSAHTVADPTIKRQRGRPRKKTLRNRELTKSTGYDNQIVHKSKEACGPPAADAMLAAAFSGGSDPAGNKTASLSGECNGDATGPQEISCSLNQEGEPAVSKILEPIDARSGSQSRHSSARRTLLKRTADQVHSKSIDKELMIMPHCPSAPEITSTGGGKSPEMQNGAKAINCPSSIPYDSVHEEAEIRLGLKSDAITSLDKSRLSEINPTSAQNGLSLGMFSGKNKQEGLDEETEVVKVHGKSASANLKFTSISQKPVTMQRVIPVVCSSETEMHYSNKLKHKGNQVTANTRPTGICTDVPSTSSGLTALPLQKDDHRSMLLQNGCMKKPSVHIKKLPKRLIAGPLNLNDHSRLAQFCQLREAPAKTKKKVFSTQSISGYGHQLSPMKSTTPLSSGGRVITPYAHDHVQSYIPTSPQKTVKLNYGEQNGQTTQTSDGTGRSRSPIKTLLKHPHLPFNSMKTLNKGKCLIMDRIKKDAAMLQGDCFQHKEIQMKFRAASVSPIAKTKSNSEKRGRGRQPQQYVSFATSVKQQIIKFHPKGPLLISKHLFSTKRKVVKDMTLSTKNVHGALVPEKCVPKRRGRPPKKRVEYLGSTPTVAKSVETCLIGSKTCPEEFHGEVGKKFGRLLKKSVDPDNALSSSIRKHKEIPQAACIKIPRKVGRPRKNPSLAVVHVPKRKLGRPQKNPSPADAVVPKKSAGEPQRCNEIKRPVGRPHGSHTVCKKNLHMKRNMGRPRTRPTRLEYTPKKQGQPCKSHNVDVSPVQCLAPESPMKTLTRKRGRPRKHPCKETRPKYPSVPLPITDNFLFRGFGFQPSAFDGFVGTPFCDFSLPIEGAVLPVENVAEIEDMPILESVFAPGSVVGAAEESIISQQIVEDHMTGDQWSLEQSQRDRELPELSCCISVTTQPVLPLPPTVSIELDTNALPDPARSQSSYEPINLPATDILDSFMVPPEEERRFLDMQQLLT